MFILVYKFNKFTCIIVNNEEYWKWCVNKEHLLDSFLLVSGQKNISTALDTYGFTLKEKRYIKKLLEKYGTKP